MYCKQGRVGVRSEESIMCITDSVLEFESEPAAAQRAQVQAITPIKGGTVPEKVKVVDEVDVMCCTCRLKPGMEVKNPAKPRPSVGSGPEIKTNFPELSGVFPESPEIFPRCQTQEQEKPR